MTMAGTNQLPETASDQDSQGQLKYYPASQVSGSDWIIDALSDLAKYCSFNQLNDIEITLRRTIWEASLQLHQAKKEDQ